jgi:hypothetical protein
MEKFVNKNKYTGKVLLGPFRALKNAEYMSRCQSLIGTCKKFPIENTLNLKMSKSKIFQFQRAHT